MSAQGQSVLLPSLAVAASAVFWGTTWIPLREIGGPGVPQEWSGLLIYLVPALLVLPMILLRHRQVIAGGLPLLVTAVAVGACNGLFAVSMVFGEIGMVILLFYLNPVWATVLERIVIGTPIAGFRWAGIGLGLLGLVALQGLAGRWPFPSNAAEWMGFLAGVCWAVGLVATNLAKSASMIEKTFLQFVFAALTAGLLVVMLGWADPVPTVEGLTASMGWILAAAAFWVIPAMGLSLWGASRMSPARASMILMLEVLVGVGSAAWLAGEELGLNKIVGGALILSASLVEAWGSARADGKAAQVAG
ncbi:DMT family transporter [Dongia sp.]|uniref:DMT family transporter n=1 Tax=Dongia sp. TaxID=1977262 RepID=UPI0037533D86